MKMAIMNWTKPNNVVKSLFFKHPATKSNTPITTMVANDNFPKIIEVSH